MINIPAALSKLKRSYSYLRWHKPLSASKTSGNHSNKTENVTAMSPPALFGPNSHPTLIKRLKSFICNEVESTLIVKPTYTVAVGWENFSLLSTVQARGMTVVIEVVTVEARKMFADYTCSGRRQNGSKCSSYVLSVQDAI